jgi:hypothetical protein
MYCDREGMEEKLGSDTPPLATDTEAAGDVQSYRYMGCAKGERLGTEFLVASAFSKQVPLFLTLKPVFAI